MLLHITIYVTAHCCRLFTFTIDPVQIVHIHNRPSANYSHSQNTTITHIHNTDHYAHSAHWTLAQMTELECLLCLRRVVAMDKLNEYRHNWFIQRAKPFRNQLLYSYILYSATLKKLLGLQYYDSIWSSSCAAGADEDWRGQAEARQVADRVWLLHEWLRRNGRRR